MYCPHYLDANFDPWNPRITGNHRGYLRRGADAGRACKFLHSLGSLNDTKRSRRLREAFGTSRTVIPLGRGSASTMNQRMYGECGNLILKEWKKTDGSGASVNVRAAHTQDGVMVAQSATLESHNVEHSELMKSGSGAVALLLMAATLAELPDAFADAVAGPLAGRWGRKPLVSGDKKVIDGSLEDFCAPPNTDDSNECDTDVDCEGRYPCAA